MPSNHLEQLVGEWYEYQGYYVKRNTRVGKRIKGGYECELDIIAFNPVKKHLVQVEPSLDSDRWPIREERFRRKFEAGKKYIPTLFPGFDLPPEIDQYALFVYGSNISHKEVGGGKVIIVNDLLKEIFHELRDRHLYSRAVPENLIILRSFQFATEYRKTIMEILTATHE